LKNKYINIHIYIPDEFQEIAYAYINDFKFTGIEEKFDEIIITFDLDNYDETIKSNILSSIKQAYPHSNIIKEEIIDDKNWNEEWEKNVPIIKVTDKIVIGPSWKIQDLQNEIKIIINPKMSFGTGEHPTTRLCCLLLNKYLFPNEFWIDVGTGTGVLSILAIKLGASKVFAFDNNYWSINNARENFELNQVSNSIDLVEFDIENINLPESDGIVANIFLNLVRNSFPLFSKSLKKDGSKLILSGILSYDKEIVVDLAEQYDFKLIEELTEDEWSAFYFQK